MTWTRPSYSCPFGRLHSFPGSFHCLLPKMPKSNKVKNSGVAWPSFNKMPVPDEMWVTLRYSEALDATASVGLYSYVFAANDVYDPNITGAGSQPLAYDQWTSIYNRWTVLASDIDVQITSRTVSGRLSVAVVPVTQSSVAPTTYEAASQMRLAKHASTTGGGPSPVIRSSVKMHELYGVPLVTIQADDAFSGATTASPNRRMAWAIVAETSGSSDALSLTINLKYKVRLFQPVLYNVSLSAVKQHARARAAAREERYASLPAKDTSLAEAISTREPEPAPDESAGDDFTPEVFSRILDKISKLESALLKQLP